MAHIREFNFVRENAKDSMHLVFDANESITFFPIEITRIDSLLAWAGVFPSQGQARNNGFSGPIPKGWSEKPKGNLRFWIWNPGKEELGDAIELENGNRL